MGTVHQKAKARKKQCLKHPSLLPLSNWASQGSWDTSAHHELCGIVGEGGIGHTRILGWGKKTKSQAWSADGCLVVQAIWRPLHAGFSDLSINKMAKAVLSHLWLCAM